MKFPRLTKATALLILMLAPAPAYGQTPYTATWSSVDTHSAAPEWFQDAKFGIYFHWGAFGAAQFGNEWYPRNMYNTSDAAYAHHVATYGDPFTDFPYDKFLTGANDKTGMFTEFAPKLVSDGGKWDPDAWAQLFVDAGARFAGPVMEHHDGFSMWDSKVNEWNSVAMGPELNLAKLHLDAFRKKGLKTLAAMHHAFHFTGFYQFAPTPSDASLKKLYGKLDWASENQLWYDKLKEVVDEFQPDILWQDFNLGAVDETKRLEFLAYYYNAARGWGKEVVATYKDGYNNRGEVFDYERGGPGEIVTPYWLTDDTVSPQSWSYVTGMPYYSDAQIVHSFIDRVSKGGNLLLNISPMPDGTIPPRQHGILEAMGRFLKQNGTAIYNTRPWNIYGEGPTKMGGGAFTTLTFGNSEDIRYTASKDGDALYAIVLGWPSNGQITLANVTTANFSVGAGQVYLFAPVGGSAISLAFTQDDSGLHVALPETQPYTAIAYAMKISKSGKIPDPTPVLTTPPPTSDGAPNGPARSSGCGCTLVDASGGSKGAWALAGLLGVAALRVRGRSGRRKIGLGPSKLRGGTPLAGVIAVILRSSRFALFALLGLAATFLAACSEDAPGAASSGGSGGTASTGGIGGGGVINQCGAAAPLPAETGQCKATSAPLFTDFDDYAGTDAGSYTYYVNAKPPAADAVLGALQHVGDGSDMDGGSSVIATEMVTGEGGSGYALQISNSNATHWGGLLMLYLPYAGSAAACLDAHKHNGVEFAIRGTSPSGRFGVTVGMLDTIPIADHGLCDKQSMNDCKDGSVELDLPSGATTWAKVQVPWSAFTTGVGSGASCVPVTGQNIVRLVIQPFMNYPPPDYMIAPGAYTLAVDNVRFF